MYSQNYFEKFESYCELSCATVIVHLLWSCVTVIVHLLWSCVTVIVHLLCFTVIMHLVI